MASQPRHHMAGEFAHPASRARLRCVAPLDPEFRKALQVLGIDPPSAGSA